MTVVKINAIEVPPGAGPELEKRFAHRAHAVDNQPGFLGFQLLRPVSGDDRYFVVTQWESEEAFQAWASGPAIAAHAGERANPVSTAASLLEFEVLMDGARSGAERSTSTASPLRSPTRRVRFVSRWSAARSEVGGERATL